MAARKNAEGGRLLSTTCESNRDIAIVVMQGRSFLRGRDDVRKDQSFVSRLSPIDRRQWDHQSEVGMLLIVQLTLTSLIHRHFAHIITLQTDGRSGEVRSSSYSKAA
jgi:hypothetical protein